jgi:hypothetical protein
LKSPLLYIAGLLMVAVACAPAQPRLPTPTTAIPTAVAVSPTSAATAATASPAATTAPAAAAPTVSSAPVALPPAGPPTRFALNQEIAGWTLLGYEVSDDLLAYGQPAELKLYWQPPTGFEGLEGAELRREGDAYVQVLSGARSLAQNGGFEGNAPLAGFPIDIYARDPYAADPSTRVAADVTREGKTTKVAALRNRVDVPGTSLITEGVPVQAGALYLQAAWIRGDDGQAYVGRYWIGPETYDYVIGAISPPEWTHYARVVQAPDGATAARLWLLNFQSTGSVEFDNVIFVELGTLRAATCPEVAASGQPACLPPIAPAGR